MTSLAAGVGSDDSISTKRMLRSTGSLQDSSRDLDELQEFSLMGRNRARSDKHKSKKTDCIILL